VFPNTNDKNASVVEETFLTRADTACREL